MYNHAYRQNNAAVFVQDNWKATSSLTVNLGLRTELLGAWTDGDCHIGNIESDLTKSGAYPFVYPKCVDKLGVSGLTGTAAGSTFRNSISTGWGPRAGFSWDVFGSHTTTLRGGYGIYYDREDIGAVDQLSFQSPFIPIVFFSARRQDSPWQTSSLEHPQQTPTLCPLPERSLHHGCRAWRN